jgi:RHS repeat-associated protein
MHLLLLVFLFFCTFGNAEETLPRYVQNASVQSVEMENDPSAIVGSVNVISGKYHDAVIDLALPGAEPIILERVCAAERGIDKKDLFRAGWIFPNLGFVKRDLEHIDEEPVSIYHVQDTSGFGTVYEPQPAGGYRVPKSALNYGINSANGVISGRFNVRNHLLEVANHSNPTLFTGSGGFQVFVLRRERYNFSISDLWMERKPCGNHIEYSYDKHGRPIGFRALNQSCQPLANVSLDYVFEKKRIVVFAKGGGRHAIYTYAKKSDSYYLTQVERSDGWVEKFSRESGKFRKEMPEGHFIEYETYQKGLNAVGNTQVQLKNNDPRIERVMLIKSPGTDSTPVITHRFFYNLNAKKDYFGTTVLGGVTGVHNALGHKCDYHFDQYQRLHALVNFDGPSPHSIQHFYWQSEGNLVSRTYCNGQEQVQCCRYLQYDGRGNVIQEELYGNLTGNNPQIVQVDANGVPQKNGCDCYQKLYEYSDHYNLLLLEVDGRQKTIYSYYPNTDLMRTRYLLSRDEKIRKRQFFVYDHNACVVAEVTDNGSALDIDDQTGVTERHFKRIHNRQIFPVGLPEVIEEFAMDAGVERILHKTVNHYNELGHLIHQDHYGSDKLLAYSLFWEYDAAGNVIKETNALGQITTYRYDLHGNKVEEQGPNLSFRKKYLYDFANRLVKEEDIYTNGTTLSISHRYDLLGNRIATTDFQGNETQFIYNEHSFLIETRYPQVLDEHGQLASPCVRHQYNILGQPIQTTDAKGLTSHYSFNLRGQPVSTVLPDGSTERHIYTGDGYLERSFAANGTETLNHLDYAGRVIRQDVRAANGTLLGQTHFEYDAFHLLSETDPMGNRTQYTYDFAGRLKAVTHGNGKLEIEYDVLGRIAKKLNHTQDDFTAEVILYDNLDRVIEERTEDAQGQVQTLMRYVYDEMGNRSELHRLGQAGEAVTKITYNVYHEPEEVINAEGEVTRTLFYYFNRNDLNQYVMGKEVIDPLGNSVYAESDALGRQVLTIYKDPFGTVVRKQIFRYDLAGNRTHAIEEEQITQWEYDLCHRPIRCIEAQGTPIQKVTSREYNAYGQLAKIIKPDGVVLTHEYDALGRLNKLDSSNKTVGYAYTYDLNNNVLQVDDLYQHCCTKKQYDQNNRLVAETLGNGLTMHYQLDGQGRLRQATYPDGSSTDYQYEGVHLKTVSRKGWTHTYFYDTAGQVTSSTLPNNGQIKNRYDRLGRLREIDAPHFLEKLELYDGGGRLLQQTISHSYKTDFQNYTYDPLDQLLKENEHTYAYDKHYNCVSQDGTTRHHNALNQLLEDGSSHYHYDANGNRIRQTGTQEIHYEYDALDRLIVVTREKEQYRYTYDELNRRLSKYTYIFKDNAWQETEKIDFLYQNQNEIGAFNQRHLLQLRILGVGKGAEIGAAVAIEIEEETLIPIHDHNGSVTALLSFYGELKEGIRYTAFGKEERHLSTDNPWRFASKRVDPETGLVYFGGRYYDPQTARWLSADPLGYDEGPNLYAYLTNNPLSQFDSYGFRAERDTRDTYDARRTANRGTPFSSGHDQREDRERRKTFIDNTIEFFLQTVVPEPFVRDLFQLTKRIIQGTGVAGYSFQKGKSFNFTTDNGKYNARIVITCTNGILTSYADFKERCELIAELTGIKVIGTYNSTHGIISDLIESACHLSGLKTEVTDLKIDAFNQAAASLGPNGVICDISYSQGGLIANYAAGKVKPEVRNKIIGYGMGTVIYNDKNFKKSMVYLNTCDGAALVMNLHQPHKYIQGRKGLLENVRFIKGKYPFISHAYKEHYHEAEREIIIRINELKNR